MKRQLLWVPLPLALSLCSLGGCADMFPVEPGEEVAEEGAGDGSEEFEYDAEPGTCDGWKVRYCEAYVQCGHGTLDECIYEAEFVACHPESPFSDCEKKFERVIEEDDCSLFPRTCYPRDIADRTEAARLCREVQAAACDFDFFCGSVFNIESCVSETSQLFACDERLSVGLGGEACVAELNRAACGDPLPSACADHTRF